MSNEKKDMIIAGMPDDYVFVQAMQGRNVRLSNFKKVITFMLSAEGQNNSYTLPASSYDFLIKNIEVFAFCKAGNFFLNGIARDLVTLTLKNTSTDDYLVDSGTDIQAYYPGFQNSSFTPTIFPANAGILASVKHERRVDETCIDFPKAGANLNSNLKLSFGHNTPPPAEEDSGIAPSPFPIYGQIILSGAKIFAN